MTSDDKKTILLVEDEVLIAMKEKMELEKKGYSVHHVNNGEDAVKVIIENSLPIDLVLMDIDLGSGINGINAAEQIHNHIDIPVIFLSSHTEPELVEKTEKITSYGYVIKNSGIIVLDASIKMALKLHDYKKKIENSETKYRVLSENTQDFIYSLDLDSRHTMVNDSVCKAMRLSQNSIVGKNHIELGFSKDVCEEWRKLHLKVIERNETIKTETSTTMPDGSYRFYEISLSPITSKNDVVTGIRGISRDITERKKAEDELRKSKELLAETESIGRVGGWSFNIDTLEQKWTDEVYRIHEVEIEPNPGVDTGINYYTKESRPIIEKAVQRAIEHGENFDLELEIITAKGNRRAVHTIGKADLKNRRVYGFFQDITERRKAQEEIKKQLEEKEILLKEVHHRVKNNMANIEGLLFLQSNAAANPEVKKALQDSFSRVKSIRVLYDKLLLSREYTDVSIKSYTENLIDSLLAAFVLKNNIIVEKHISEFSIVSKQAVTIGIIINELMTNVFKYAFKDGDNGTVSITIGKDEKKVSITIQDNGMGIDERIMENKSPGFGLTVVKMLVAQLKGTFNMVNDNGTKSTVYFEI